MTSTTILLKGKYLGSTFQDVLLKDLNYCKFIISLKFPSVDMKEFQDWLKVNIDEAIAKHIERELAKMAKRLSN